MASGRSSAAPIGRCTRCRTSTTRDGSRRSTARVTCGSRWTRPSSRDLATVLLAAEAAGGAGWCLDTASSYAKVREQFGRPIGQFQAVKHRCADMLVGVEQAVGAAWDAARAADDPDALPLAAAVAGAIAPEVFVACAKDCVQVLGGIGFTWEHDAHLYLKRALAVRQLLGGTTAARRRTAALASAGTRRALTLDLPEDADSVREGVRAFVASVRELDRDAAAPRRGRRRLLRAPLAIAVGTRRRSARAARHRRGVPRRPGSSRRTSRSARGRRRRSSPTAPQSSRSGGCGRRCTARWRGASCSASLAPVPTSRR